jgi:predicted regulator of Ras-like GTPase activity (Roadblock/LC7/MglB family)
MMGFTDTLTEIIYRIEGCAAVIILGIDGIPIERQIGDLDPTIDLDLMVTEFTTLVRRNLRTAADTELGAMQEMVFVMDLLTLVARPITPEYFLLVALNPGGNVGRARFELRKAQLAMEAEFAI